MKVLISCVGDSDPIRGNHDSSILHIARFERPDEIVLIHSERTESKHDDIIMAINAISGYKPRIIKYREVIPNEKTPLYDDMYEFLSDAVDDIADGYDKQTDFMINMSSGTAQMQSSLFTINIVQSRDFKCLSVASPRKDSNAGTKYDTDIDITERIATNEDHINNIEDVENRIIVSKAEKFGQNLIQKSARRLIERYDYDGAYQLIKYENNLPNADKLLPKLKQATTIINRQDLPPKIKQLKGEPIRFKRALNGLLLINMKYEIEDVAQVLVRVVAYSEYIIEDFLNSKFPNLIIRPKKQKNSTVNKNRYPDVFKVLENTNDYKWYRSISFYQYMKIINYLLKEDSKARESFEKVNAVRSMRNIVAHDLGYVEDRSNQLDDESKAIDDAVQACEDIFFITYPTTDSSLLNVYKDFNQELFELLK